MSTHWTATPLSPRLTPIVRTGGGGAAQAVLLFCLIATGYLVLVGIYNVFFHPLRRFPGPFWRAATPIPFVVGLNRGINPRQILALHEQYGPIVRVSPHDLSFLDPEAWKDIYGHRVGANSGLQESGKAPILYRFPGDPATIVSEGRENHALLRKQMSHGFSERSMKAQEPLIGVYVDQLISQLRKYSENGDAQLMDVWYNRTTFDIIGDLAFGEPFDLVKHAANDPMAGAVITTSKLGLFNMSLRYMGVPDPIVHLIKYLFTPNDDPVDSAGQKLRRREKLGAGRDDLIEGLMRKQTDWNLSFDQIRQNASILLIAGSETTATLLSGVTYLLLKNPDAMEKLLREVRGAFQSESDITLSSVSNLPYMLACLNEALRRYPPVPIGLPRSAPKGGTVVVGEIIPENTRLICWQWAMNHSKDHFKDPLVFKPERWLGDPTKTEDRLDAVQPFSLGPRNCIGKNLAIAEMRLILARLLFTFDLKLDESCDEDWINQKAYIFWEKKPLPVVLTPRF